MRSDTGRDSDRAPCAPTHTTTPSRNDGVTTTHPAALCAACGHGFRPVGRRRFCSDACRQAAFRRRHLAGQALAPLQPGRGARATTVYECPACGARLLGEQRCPDCGVFCRRVGPGGSCPHCDEPVAIADLVPSDPNDRR
jgi:hypothetical protein